MTEADPPRDAHGFTDAEHDTLTELIRRNPARVARLLDMLRQSGAVVTTEADPQLAELRELEKAATPGPWAWRGNDDGLVELRGHGPFGRLDGRVISAQRSEPCTAQTHDEEVVLTYEACDDCKAKWAQMLVEGHTDMWEGYRCPKPENLATVWLKGEHAIEPANRWAVRQRDYRSDVAEVDHPDAKFIAAARTAVPALLAEIERLRALVGGRSAAPTRDEVRAAVMGARHRPDSRHTLGELYDDAVWDAITDAVVALFSRPAAEPPERIEGEFVKRDGTVVDGWPDGRPIGRYTTAGLVYGGVAAEPNEEAGDG